ncbi:hypothetical protein ABGB07_01605 [Micromonosporaceae bacterium B7E4]
MTSPAYDGGPSAARLPPPPLPDRLPWWFDGVLARDEPARLLLDLASVRQDVRTLTTVLERGTVYHVDRQLDAASEQADDLARRISRLRRQVYTGRCGRLRGRERYGGYVSVRDRDVLGDGGLHKVSRLLNELADTLKRLHGREPWYVRVRDSSLAGTRDTITAFTSQLANALDGIAVDVTCADLSGRSDLNLAALRNAIWSSRTVWPPSLADAVRARSRPLCRDVFQIVAD